MFMLFRLVRISEIEVVEIRAWSHHLISKVSNETLGEITNLAQVRTANNVPRNKITPIRIAWKIGSVCFV